MLNVKKGECADGRLRLEKCLETVNSNVWSMFGGSGGLGKWDFTTRDLCQGFMFNLLHQNTILTTLSQ